MRFVIFFSTILLIILLFYLYILPSIDRGNCVESGGVWYEKYCLNENTSDSTLNKLGLLLEERNDKYQIDIVYPVGVLNFPKIHSHLKEHFDAAVSEFKNRISNNQKKSALKVECDQLYLVLNFGVVFCKINSFLGRSQQNHSFLTVNFDIDNQEVININSLFKSSAFAMDNISRYVKRELYKAKSKKLRSRIIKDDWIESGASANPGNFSNFILLGDEDKVDGIKVVFSPYQVGSFREGVYEVEVPVEVFSKYLLQKGNESDEKMPME